MNNKYQYNQNYNKANKNNKSQDIYRNDSELANKNSYMIYELNNTFNDKDKDVFDGSVKGNLNNNNSFKKLDSTKTENKNE